MQQSVMQTGQQTLIQSGQQTLMQSGPQALVMTQQKQLQPKAMDMMTPQQQQQQVQQQKLQQHPTAGMKKTGIESSDWSPVTDLSPILDVSPSLEAAEQELMEKCVQQEQLRPSIPRAQSGTISSLLADFNKSVGQTTPTIDDGQQRGLGIVPQQQQVGSTTTTQKNILAPGKKH